MKNGIGAKMGVVVKMYAEYKNKEGEWENIDSPAKPCCFPDPYYDEQTECDCRNNNWYCPYAKHSVFFEVLCNHVPKTILPRTDDYHETETVITLTDLNNFDWNKEIVVSNEGKRNRQGFEEGMHKCSDICRIFLHFTLPHLNTLSAEYGGPDNIRINFYFW